MNEILKYYHEKKLLIVLSVLMIVTVTLPMHVLSV